MHRALKEWTLMRQSHVEILPQKNYVEFTDPFKQQGNKYSLILPHP